MKPDDAKPPDDPIYLRARKEGLVALGAWLVACLYTVGAYALFGRNLDPENIKTIWGIPSWVVWGIIAPWMASLVFAGWYSLVYIKDEDLGEEPEEPFHDGS